MTTKAKLLILVLFIAQASFSQDNKIKNENTMETSSTTEANRRIIISFYNDILNGRRLNELNEIVSTGYRNERGESGVEAFATGIKSVLAGFSDAKWTIEEVVANQETVFVKQRVTGTHTGTLQGIEATGRKISNPGFAIYRFQDGKIISHEIQTDRFLFLQELGVLSEGYCLNVVERNQSAVYFVDKFDVPADAADEFFNKMQYNRNFIKSLHGFIEDKVLTRPNGNGGVTIVTIAVWASEEDLAAAKERVQEEYRRINFNPAEFVKKANISMTREQYSAYESKAKK